MGCDIHLFAERRTRDGWQLLPAPDSDTAYREISYRTKGFLNEWFEDRNYYLFSMLAGVRGYISYPLEDPRGMPADPSPEYVEESKNWEGHSHSYFTVAELRSYFALKLSHDYCGNFLLLLDELETYGAAEDVRIVFFFDN